MHASPTEWPELQQFLASFQGRFRRPEGREARQRDTTGLLTELANKICDTIAQTVPGTSEQRLREFLTNMPWDEHDLNRQRVRKLIAEATLGEGVLVLDDTGFPKQGKASVGVARQYSGTLGKVGNCQMAVTCGDTDSQATWPVAVRLYLPKPWAETPSVGSRRVCPQGCASRPSRRLPSLSLIRRGPGRSSIVVWWQMPTTGTTRTFWRAWRRDRSAMWLGCGLTSRCA